MRSQLTPLDWSWTRLTHVLGAFFVGLLVLVAQPALAQDEAATGEEEDELVSLDFSDVELPVVIDTISRMTGFNFIYDDRVRGRVTIVSPTQVTIEQAFAVFESVLKVKGFSLVLGPGNTYKIIPIRDVKESSIDTIKDGRPSRNRDRFVTRLVPLRYIDAASITQTIKPLVSKDASLVAYAATNTIIVTDSESNIRRLLSILDAIDVESYRNELAVIKVDHADANMLGQQLSEIYGAEVASAAGGATAAQRRTRSRRRTTSAGSAAAANAPASGGLAGPSVKILTDERTNSLLILSSRQQLADIRKLVQKLDIPVTGGGRIHVYYLRHADAEELSETLNSLLSGAGSGGGARAGAAGGGAANVQSLRSVVTPLAEGVTVTADPATNSLVIQASKEAYETLRGVIDRLDVSRPQVLVEALIVEVDVTDSLDLGVTAALRLINGDTDILFSTGAALLTGGSSGLLAAAVRSQAHDNPGDAFNPAVPGDQNGTNLKLGISASKSDADVNIVSAPHILTSDNEEAEIRIGQNIPIVTGRTDAATGSDAGLAQAVSVERQDIGITLRVTPQISEGDTVRLQLFQELTEVTESEAGNVEDVGVTLTSRKVENTVVVNDGETVVIGGLISESFTDAVSGVPWLADIPYLGWLFKQKAERLRKINLLIFLTPHIVRSADDLEQQTIRKRLEMEDAFGDERQFAELAEYARTSAPAAFSVKERLVEHSARYPIERMRELEERRAEKRAEHVREVEEEADSHVQRYAVQIATFLDEAEAMKTLTTLLDAGYDGTLVSNESGGRIVFNVLLGPFDELWEAERSAATLDAAYGYSSFVTVLFEDDP